MDAFDFIDSISFRQSKDPIDQFTNFFGVFLLGIIFKVLQKAHEAWKKARIRKDILQKFIADLLNEKGFLKLQEIHWDFRWFVFREKRLFEFPVQIPLEFPFMGVFEVLFDEFEGFSEQKLQKLDFGLPDGLVPLQQKQ